MLPISIKIKGIYSYQTEQFIDFTELTKDKLFGIFGAVGSGKSAILEAMIIALYRKSERLKGSFNYNLMNLKSKELSIDFEFKAGRGNEKYRFTARGKRNSKNFDDVKTLKYDSYTWSDGDNDWIPNDLKAEDILGLDYENFKRTIIIPQGQFQEFIHLKDADRGKMLEKVFHLHQFDLSHKIKQLEIPNKSSIDNHTGQLKQLEEVKQKLINDKIKTEKKLSKEIESNKKKLKPLEKNLIQQNSFFENIKQFQKTEKEFENLSQKLPEQEKLKTQLAYFIECKTKFAEDINRILDLEKECKVENEAFAKLQEEKKQLQKKEATCKVEAEKLAEKHKDLTTLETKCSDLTLIKLILGYQKQIAIAQKSLKEQKVIIEDFEKKEIEPVNKSIVEKESILQKEGEIDFKIYTEKSKWLNDFENIDKEINSARKKYTTTDGQLSKIKEEDKQILSKYLPENKIDLTKLDINQTIELLNSGITKIDRSLEQQEKKLVDLRAEKKLSDFSAQLKDGEPCKLCGSLEHPHPHTAKEVDEKEKTILQDGTKLKNKKKNVQAAIKELEQTLFKVGQLTTELNKIKKEGKEMKGKYDNLKSNSPFVNITAEKIDIPSLNKALETEKKQFENQQKIQKELGSLRKNKEVILKEKEKLERAFSKTENELGLHKQSIKQSEFNLKELKRTDFENSEESDIQQKIKEFEEDFKVYTKVEEELKSIAEIAKNNSIRIEEKEKSLTNKNKALEERKKSLNTKINKSEFENIEEITNSLELKINIEKTRKSLDSFFEKYNTVQARKKQLEKSASKITYNEKKHAELKEQVETSKQNIEEQTQKIGELKQEVGDLQIKIKSKERLENALAELKIREENIKILKKLFTGKGFVNYVASIKLRNLCTAANKRFEKLTYNHLSLELVTTAKSSEIVVRDRMNENKTRSIRTLSGGQTFQASLCMAIALSDIVNQHNGEKADFFFLDEGFGSLDKNSMRIVFETLQELRKENKIVGVISHVDELQEEIQTHLTIKNGEEGSKISKSWA